MANEKHAVIRTDLMSGTYDGSLLRSFKYHNAEGKMADIDNGHVVKLEALMDGEREVWKAVDPAADTPLKDIAIVAGVEVMYDERKKNLDEYYNVAGKAVRGFMHHTNQYHSVTAEALDGTPEVGKYVEIQAGTKLKVADAAGDATLGKIVAIEQAGRYTYYVIKHE